jgi:secreted trypsin-like serine protease
MNLKFHLSGLLGCLLACFSACKQKTVQDSEVEMAGGTVVRGSEPFLGTFVYLLGKQSSEWGKRCSGVLLGPRHVLTAAHCVETVRSIEVSRLDRNLKATKILAGSWQMHPDWPKWKNKNGPESHKSDLAIVILGQDVGAPFARISASDKSNVNDAFYVGIGRSEGDKSDSKVRYAENIDAFRLKYKPDGGTWISRGAAILCSGDSGGPLFSKDGSLLGIASAVAFTEGQIQSCGNGKRVYHSDVRENIVWIVCAFAKAGYPLSNFPVPSAESCK